MISSTAPRPSARRALMMLVLAAALLLPTSAATAHDVLVGTSPADGESVDTPPTEVVLEFSADQLDLGAQVQVVDPSGQDRATGDAQVSGPTVSQALDGAGEAGEWTVTWRSVANDGHPVTGELTFEVRQAAPVPGEEPAEDSPEDAPAPAEGDAGATPAEDEGTDGSGADGQGPAVVEDDVDAVDGSDEAGDEREGPGLGLLALLALGGLAAVLTVLALLRRGGPGRPDA